MLFEIRNYTSNILYIKRIKTLVFNYLYYNIVDIIIVYVPLCLVDMQM